MSKPLTPYDRWDSGTQQNSIPANDNSLRDEIFNTDGIADDVTAQPGSPADGDWYIIPAGATGTQWTTFAENSVAIFYGGTWYEFVPAEGNIVTVAGDFMIYESGAWAAVTIPASAAAEDVTYDNTASGLAATEVQAAIDELAATGGGIVQSIVAGTNVTVDSTDPANPIISASGGGGGMTNPMTTAGDIIVGGTSGAPARLGVGTDGQVLTLVSGAPAWSAGGGGGGLTHWTEGVNTTSPNGTTPVATLTATNAASNADAAIIPKGQGAFLSQVPDSSATGGNKRGQYSVDFQRLRSAAAQVASGNHAVILHGQRNIASGEYSQAGGFACTASGSHSRAFGNGADTRNCQGMEAFGGGSGVQRSGWLHYVSTTNATPTLLSADGFSTSSAYRAVIPTNRAGLYHIMVTARQTAGTGTGDCASWHIYAMVKNIAGTVSLVGSATPVLVAADAGAAAWAVAATANNSVKCLDITVTGEASKTIQWAATIRGPEG